MDGGIFLIQPDNSLLKLQEEPPTLEVDLQQLLATYPDLLPGDQINSADPRRWLFVAREATLPMKEGGAWRSRLDHLFLDQDAIPTLVEVKLSSNPEIYQHIVAQLLAYAANATSSWTAPILRAFFEKSHPDPDDQTLDQFLLEDADPDAFWQKAETNLRAGILRLIFVVDRLPEELRGIIEFLNLQMSPAEVLGVEVRQYANQGVRTLVPRLIGQTSQTQKRKSGGISTRMPKTEEAFFQELESTQGPALAALAGKILTWTTETHSLPNWWGSGEDWIAFAPKIMHLGADHWFVWISSNANFEIIFNQMRKKSPFGDDAMRLELLRRLNAIPGMNLPDADINKRPKRKLSLLLDDDALSQFLDTYDWYIQQIKASS